MKYRSTNKYGILLLGYVLLFGTYFTGRSVQFLSRETAHGEVRSIAWKDFVVGVPPSGRGGGGGDLHNSYQRPEIIFLYAGASDTVRPESLSFKEYKPGDQVAVIFPNGHPEQARIYSAGEFWFTPAYMIIVGVIAGLWTIGFVVVVFKPWKMMDE